VPSVCVFKKRTTHTLEWFINADKYAEG